MNITDMSVWRLDMRQEDSDWSFALASYPVISGYVVELTAEDGTTGYGYTSALPHLGSTMESIAAGLHALESCVIGKDALSPESIFDAITRALPGNAQAKCGIDCAAYDLAARLMNAPLASLFGGAVRSSIEQMRILPIKSPQEMAKAAAALVEAGYRCLKIKLKGDEDADFQRVSAIRDAVGPTVMLTLDANQSYSPKSAIRILNRMERLNIALCEQPVAAEDWRGMALVTRSVPMIIEADESAETLDQVFHLAAERTVDAISLKIPKLGGLRNTMAAARICDAAGLQYRIGATFGSRLLAAQATHLACALPHLDLPCELSEFEHLMDDAFEGLSIQSGRIEMPRAAGTGVTRVRATVENS